MKGLQQVYDLFSHFTAMPEKKDKGLITSIEYAMTVDTTAHTLEEIR